ncbi:MAG: ASCH domain-containing protein [Candidatus Melainabacteria bacterium]|nr:ASCH domain-containing protein [Candidatus Melainabacteria bacterium]
MPIVKRLVFGEGLMSPTLEGRKTITLRKYRPEAHDFKKGEVVVGEFKDGLDILLKITRDTEVKPISELTDEEAVLDGFDDAQAAFDALKGYYPDIAVSDELATIRFRALRYQGTPSVQFNQHATETQLKEKQL